VPGGTGTVAAPPPVQAPDRSRSARLLNPERWQRIEFPEEANTDGVDDAYVTLKIAVDAQGSPTSVTVVQDPGHGFARQAKQFALRQKYDVAFDRDGKPIPGVCNPRIHFTR
jgi:outer membrane biosynthesis protein TonB